MRNTVLSKYLCLFMFSSSSIEGSLKIQSGGLWEAWLRKKNEILYILLKIGFLLSNIDLTLNKTPYILSINR